MRVLFVSDFHLNNKFIKKTVDVVKKEKIDLVVNNGDYLSNDYAEKFFKAMNDINTKTFTINGNWDGDLESNFENVKVLQNNMESFKGFFFYGIDENDLVEEELYENTKDADPRKLIILGHYPPYKLRDRMWNGANIGFKVYTKFIKDRQPLIFSCGHIHEDNGVTKAKNTLVINSALAAVPSGYIVDIPEESNIKELKIKKVNFL